MKSSVGQYINRMPCGDHGYAVMYGVFHLLLASRCAFEGLGPPDRTYHSFRGSKSILVDVFGLHKICRRADCENLESCNVRSGGKQA